MPDVTYEVHSPKDDPDRPILLQVVSYDSEGENLAGVTVHLEIDTHGSFEAESLVTRLTLVTNARGKALLTWHAWPPDAPDDRVSTIKATWQGTDPFVFIERYRESSVVPGF